MSSPAAVPPSVGVAAPPISNARLATILFIASEVMLFAGLVVGYVVLRFGSDGFEGMRSLPVGLTAVSTPILLLSSIALVISIRALRQGRMSTFRLGALASLILGSAFLLLQVIEWTHLTGDGLIPAGSVHSGMFYLLSGVHGLHVVLGLVILAMLAVQGYRGKLAPQSGGITAVAPIYWHFVTIVWLALFVMIFGV
jgi:heme/copper-type cytochrome/quinol oxidase subunit 3